MTTRQDRYAQPLPGPGVVSQRSYLIAIDILSAQSVVADIEDVQTAAAAAAAETTVPPHTKISSASGHTSCV